MQFKEDTSVWTVDDQEAGRLKYVVMDPRTKEVTHIVVRKGLLFNVEKVIPLSLIAMADDKRITLRLNSGDVGSLPNFEETHYVTEDHAHATNVEKIPPLYWYPPLSSGVVSAGFWQFQPPTIVERNIPPQTVAVKEGAKVIAADDEEVGSIEQILTAEPTEKAAYFVIAKGLLQKEKRLIPTSWVTRVEEDKVHLAVSSTVIDKLRLYQAD